MNNLLTAGVRRSGGGRGGGGGAPAGTNLVLESSSPYKR